MDISTCRLIEPSIISARLINWKEHSQQDLCVRRLLYTIINVCCIYTVYIGIYLGGIYNNTHMSPVLGAVDAAIEIAQEFCNCDSNDISINIALHCGI